MSKLMSLVSGWLSPVNTQPIPDISTPSQFSSAGSAGVELNLLPEETESQPVRTALDDTDGIPPGVDRELTGTYKAMRFTGPFFAYPEHGDLEIIRPVQIIFASDKVYTAYDVQNGNVYVVLRDDNISQGCLMHTELLPVEENFKGFKPVFRPLPK